MRIRKLLKDRGASELITIRPEDSLLSTAQLLVEKKIGAFPVVDGKNSIVGIISERDLVRSMAKFHTALFEKTVSDVMTSPVITCGEEDSIDGVYDLMMSNQTRHMPVVEGNSPTGMLSLRDFEHAYRYLRENSLTDELTGVANSRSFLENLEGEFNRFRRFQSPMSVISIKLRNYQDFVETQGAAEGEKLLRELAASIGEETRSFDFIGHVADDEFAIVLPNTETKAARRACERLVRVADLQLSSEATMAELSVSIGLAFATADTRESGHILKSARVLADKARENGRNCFEIEEVANVQPEELAGEAEPAKVAAAG